MSREPLLDHQSAIVPLALFCTLAVVYPAWRQHTLYEVGPSFQARSLVDSWAAKRIRDEHCIAASVELRISTMSPALNGEDQGPWFGTLSCNQPRIAWRMAAIVVLPWASLTLLSYALRTAKPKR